MLTNVPPLQIWGASQVQEIVGEDSSAATVAKLVTAGTDEVDIAENLKKVHMAKLPYHMQCDKAVWKVLDAGNRSAAAAKRQTFAYVDLAAKVVLPLWLPQDTIGGKSLFGSEWHKSDAGATSLPELGQALQAATLQRKIFRSIAQRTGAFCKYAAAATPMYQMSCSRALAYMSVVMRIHEQKE